jgi:hypothetical protein
MGKIAACYLQCNLAQHRVCSTLTSRQMEYILCNLLILPCSFVSNNIISFKIIGINSKYAPRQKVDVETGLLVQTKAIFMESTLFAGIQ